jgi:hypothetical protein
MTGTNHPTDKTSDAPRFTTADLQLLLDLLRTPREPGYLRRAPWTWAALDTTQAGALARMVQQWVDDYNRVHAVTEKEIIPPCWPHHHGLAHELAALVWLHHHVHHEATATPPLIADYHSRYLPAFRTRLDRLLGRDPASCRTGQHPATWRAPADDHLARYVASQSNSSALDELTARHFGFPR